MVAYEQLAGAAPWLQVGRRGSENNISCIPPFYVITEQKVRGSERGSGTLTACSHESVLRLAIGLVGPFSRQLLSDCEACRGE